MSDFLDIVRYRGKISTRIMSVKLAALFGLNKVFNITNYNRLIIIETKLALMTHEVTKHDVSSTVEVRSNDLIKYLSES